LDFNKEDCLQFKVPQDINLEDKIVGPLTIVQFIYLLSGGIICYLIFNALKGRVLLAIVIMAPIAIFALALAFFKVQDQPLIHFVKAGLIFWSSPKTRLWKRQGEAPQIIYEGPKKKTKEQIPIKRIIDKSELEKLAYVLDTSSHGKTEQKHFGNITSGFEKLLEKNKIGGAVVNNPKTK
jgi:hypothetical protein